MKIKHLLARTAFLAVVGCSPKTYQQIDYLQDIDGEHVMLLKNNLLSNAIESFLKTLLEFFGYTFSSIKELIENARELQSMFVTPNDLCFNIENAQKLGFVNLDRTSENLASDKITTKYNTNT